MQNQKKPIQQKKPMQNFTAEKWADKIALFIDNFGFLSGFSRKKTAAELVKRPLWSNPESLFLDALALGCSKKKLF